MSIRDRTPVGQAQLPVPRFGLGCAPLGGLYAEVTREQAEQTIAAALTCGVAYFDTAPLYGYGLAERRLGAVLAGRRPDSFVLSTKVGRVLRAGAPLDPAQSHGGAPFYHGTPEGVGPVFDFSANGIRLSLEESIERLGGLQPDVVLLHDPQDHAEEALKHAYPVLREWRHSGRVAAIGVGMNRCEPLVTLARAAKFDLFLVAGRYTLLDQSAATELLPECLARGISVVAGGVLNSGALASRGRDARFDYLPASPQIIERVERLGAVCAQYHVPLLAAAMQFPLGHPAVVSVVVGARSPEEVAANVEMFERPIPSELWSSLKEEGLLPRHVPTPQRR